MLVTFPLLLLLFSGGHALVPFVDKFIQGDDSEDFDALEDRSNDLARKNTNEYTAETLRGILYGTVGSKIRHDNRNHFVQHPKDDENLDLVMDFLRDGTYDKTGQLKYDSVPVVLENLIKDVLNVIYSREEYRRLLNNPERSVMTEIVKEMIRIPTQTVLQQQLFHKIVEERAWRMKFIDPMIENNKRNKLINFGRHLLEAKRNGTLSTEDTTDFNHNLENFAFFDRDDDKEFKGLVDRLIEAFGTSVRQTQDNEANTQSTDQAAKKSSAHRHGFGTSVQETENETTAQLTSSPTTDVPKRHSDRISYLVPKFRRSEFLTTGRYETTTPYTTTGTAEDVLMSRYPFTSDTRIETTTNSYGTFGDYTVTSDKNQRKNIAGTPKPEPQACDPNIPFDCDPVPPEDDKNQRKNFTGTPKPEPQACDPKIPFDCNPVPPEHDRIQRKNFAGTPKPEPQACNPNIPFDCDPVPPEDDKNQRKNFAGTPKPEPQACNPNIPFDCDPVPPEDDKNQRKNFAGTPKPEPQACNPNIPFDCDPVPPEHDKNQRKNFAGTPKPEPQACDPTIPFDCDPVPPEHDKNRRKNFVGTPKPEPQACDPNIPFDCDPVPPEHDKNQRKNFAGTPKPENNANKTSNRKSVDNSSGKVSSNIKDNATENPIVYVQGVNDDEGYDSVDSGIKKGSIKKPKNKNFIDSNKNLTNKTLSGKSVDNLSRSPNNSHKG
ncbi:hypothetical protein CAEBREN_23419 [Caenorhabditis brenneri]|uniref:Uncharacterized protein n=1 Tax=Caenorhabditis brenneri TaxID=135651 RepID=G0MAF7_CAEBE|nr:hypothetical protein CAEBREN_23419 [Caenorhabditis brenneri]